MFREEYHKANDNIRVNYELLEKIKNTKTKKRKSFYPHITVAASVMIVAVTLLTYPKLKITKEPENNPVPVVENVVNETKVQTPTVTEEPQNESGEKDFEYKDNQNTVVVKPDKTEADKKDYKKASRAVAKEEKVIAETAETPKPYPEELKNSQVEKASEIIVNSETETQGKARSIQPNNGEVMGVTSDMVQKDALLTEEWTNEDYFEYIGREIKPAVPADLEDVTPEQRSMTVYAETREPYFDSWTLKYESEDKERNVSLRLSKTTEQNSVNQSGNPEIEGYQQSEIVKDGVKCNVKAIGLTNEEFKGLCDSI